MAVLAHEDAGDHRMVDARRGAVGASTGFSINEAVGAFMLVGVMLIATGLFKPLTRLISRIPASVASGMLAGIVVTFAINAVKTIPSDPLLILPLIAAFFVIRLFNPALSVLAVLVGGGVLAFVLGRVGTLPAPEMSTLTLTSAAVHADLGHRPGAAALSGDHGLAEPLRPRRAEGRRLRTGRRAADRRHRPDFADHRAIQRAHHQSRRDLGGDLHRPRRSSRSRPSAGRPGRSTRLPISSSRCSAPRWSRYSPCCRHRSSCWLPASGCSPPLANALAIALRDDKERIAATVDLRGHGIRADAVRHRLGILGTAGRTWPCSPSTG